MNVAVCQWAEDQVLASKMSLALWQWASDQVPVPGWDDPNWLWSVSQVSSAMQVSRRSAVRALRRLERDGVVRKYTGLPYQGRIVREMAPYWPRMLE